MPGCYGKDVFLMSRLQLISNYKENDSLRHSFNQLANGVFGIDFEVWYQAGLWDDRYVCHSYLDGDRVVANVSTTRLEMIITGERKSAVQIGTVMTDPDYRRRGLASCLLKTVLEEMEPNVDAVYLFPDDAAIHLYQRFGFRSLTVGNFSMDLVEEWTGNSIYQKLDLKRSRDLQRFVRLSAERTVLSRVFDVVQGQGILGWYCVGAMANDLYDLVDQDCLVICRQNKNVLHMFDVISRERVRFYDLMSSLGFVGVTRVVFHFTLDFPDLDRFQMTFEPGEVMMIKPETLRIEGNFSHPITAHA